MTTEERGVSAWIVVTPDFDPPVHGHLQYSDDRAEAPGEDFVGDDWRTALAWARERASSVFIRFDYAGEYLWTGDGPAPSLGQGPLLPLPDRPTVPVDEWLDEIRALRHRIAELERDGEPERDDGNSR